MLNVINFNLLDMKKYRIIGLSVLLAMFIASNFIISLSFEESIDSSISLLLNQASADPEDGYGNDQYGTCDYCSLYINGVPVDGVYIHCWTQNNSYCINTGCTLGLC